MVSDTRGNIARRMKSDPQRGYEITAAGVDDALICEAGEEGPRGAASTGLFVPPAFTREEAALFVLVLRAYVYGICSLNGAKYRPTSGGSSCLVFNPEHNMYNQEARI